MKKYLIFSLFVLLFISCEKNKVKQVSEAKEEKTIDSTANIYLIDTVNSTINWSGKHLLATHGGELKLSKGTIAIKNNKLEGGNFVIAMNTINSTNLEEPQRDLLNDHLKGADFFDVEKYPEAIFTITSVTPLTDEYNIKIEGNLQIKGISKNISIMANITITDNEINIRTEKFFINRQDYNIVYSNNNPKDKIINDLLEVQANIIAKK